MTPRPLALGLLAAVLTLQPALADPASVERGRRLAQMNCAACHATGGRGDSPKAEAPPFRELQARAPDRSLEEIFARGTLVGHSGMPNFGLAPADGEDLLAYLHTLNRSGRPRS